MRRLALIATVVATAFLLLTGCVKEPVAELSAAKAAVESAKAGQADKYVASEFAALQDSLTIAAAEIAKQKATTVLIRKYDKAVATLAFIVANAPRLTEKATEEKAIVQKQADDGVARAVAAVAEVKDAVKKIPAKGKDAKAEVESVQKAIGEADVLLSETQTLLTNSDIIAARDNVPIVIAKAESVKARIVALILKSTPAAKVKGKKKK